jgi:hypothetical protein
MDFLSVLLEKRLCSVNAVYESSSVGLVKKEKEFA